MPKSFDSFRVKASLPDELAALNELAYNLYWTWNHDAIELFRRLDRDLWDQTNHNPVKMLGMIKQDRLSQASSDEGFIAQLRQVYEDYREYMSGTSWFASSYRKFDNPKIAYFSMEFGLTECLPIYSGGLGILAGDHLKSASELGLPLVGVGLLYQQGYFQQYLNADGWQQETYPDNDFYNLPLVPELDENNAPILIGVEFPGRIVQCRIWRAQVGRIPLYLLDTNTGENSFRDRKITYQLYGGDEETRIQQELILGVGGMRVLRRMDIHVHVCHMNEGHAAFMALERVRHRKEKDKLKNDEAFEVVKGGTIFTTHTPVPAGIDIFSQSLVENYCGNFIKDCGISKEEIMALGRRNPNDSFEPLNMALMALRTTSYANGVSALHGEVSRNMWRSIWPNVPLDEIPIGHVTNGIHVHSWISKEMSELFLRYLGPNWIKKPSDNSIWERVERIPDVELWRIHERRRERLVGFTRKRLTEQLKRRGASKREVDIASETLNPEALTIGFARRFATYKRATLLLRDPERLKNLLTNPERPVQFIFAGKAHPRDNQGKELIRQLSHFAQQESVRKHFVFLENYDITVARYLVEGVDVWLNNPRRPKEASGTSGMKILPNGGLNFSVLDGWWCEGFDTDTGWAIGQGEDYDDPYYQDEIESKSFYHTLENDIIPLFYDLGSDGLARNWIAKMKNSMMKLSPMFSSNRMVMEYTSKFYMKAYDNWKSLSSDNYMKTKNLVKWKKHIKENWRDVKINYAQIESKETEVGYALKVTSEVYLGKLREIDVVVQCYSGPLDADNNIAEHSVESMKFIECPEEGVFRYEGYILCDESGLYGYSIRILPYHPDMTDQFGLEMMHWIGKVPNQRIKRKPQVVWEA
ncbi:MAG: glycosyltransferase family 1 protein [candidate division Zixibacteria bacterium]|nr:glycosyltransferase family 1 protein [candidate division Zixibacteria bacterium]